MTTPIKSAVSRVTMRKYRITLAGGFPSEGGRRIVATLGPGDSISLREERTQTKYTGQLCDVLAWMARKCMTDGRADQEG